MARNIPPETVFLGQVPFFMPEERDSERSDFRDVPRSDEGNRDYADRGMLGSYTPTSEPYHTPRDVQLPTGYGATGEDIDRGFVRAVLREDPAYDLANYKDRLTRPRSPDEDDNAATAGPGDFEFRARHERSRGFLTRPRIPTDR